ncbi:MAG TPA: response regulator transcription factor [Terriglobia bacterium]|nr:response regulator transcription factor [Terriglobia bacterium]
MNEARILIGDDHAIVRRGLRALVESHAGWAVCAEASNGRETVQKVDELKPDVAIVDIGMPELNGLDATRQILKANPQTEVLILTMHQSEEVVAEVLKAGARGYVLKSDADQNLVTAIEALLQHKPFLSSNVTEVVLSEYVNRRSTDIEAGSRITEREREVIQLLTEGKSNKEVASALDISTRTVETHRANIMRKLGLESMGDLVRYAIRNKIIDL